MEKKNIKEYLQEMLDRWNKYDELDGFVADNFRVDLEKTLEYWDLRIKDNEQELDRAREEGREELLNSIVVGIEQLRSIVMMFNPMSAEIRAKQSGEIEAYNGLLERLSKLTTK